MKLKSNNELQLAQNFINFTDKNLFLTGKAGTGKTTFLHNLKKTVNKRMVVVAPTGVAAINAGGVTIHSFFQISFAPAIPEIYFPADRMSSNIIGANQNIRRFNREKINIIRSMDLLVIDEISMVRADLLDSIDGVLRRFRNHKEAFGGVQLLMIGDIHQLAPVIKRDEWAILGKYYKSEFFFSSMALSEVGFISIELIEIFRQKDDYFIELLNKIRNNQFTPKVIQALDRRYKQDFNPDDSEGYITLTTHNYQAQSINEKKLKQLKTKSHFFNAAIEGTFPEHIWPTNENLELKVGSQVMFIKNDPSPEKFYFNGKIGRIVEISDEIINVKCPNEKHPIAVGKLEWNNYKYSLNNDTNKIEEKIIGTFFQIPLKTAWAITIHKSQGLTFEKIVIDAKNAFAHGQVYVALSRCKSLEGLVLSSRLSSTGVSNRSLITNFVEKQHENIPNDEDLKAAKILYNQRLLSELFSFEIIKITLFYCRKLIYNHKDSLIGDALGQLHDIINKVDETIISVAGKIQQRIKTFLKTESNPQENKPLDEKVVKATIYFNNMLKEKISEPLKKINLDADNKKIKNDLKKAFEGLEKEIEIKSVCLESCTSGFDIKALLEAKAHSVIEKPKKQKQKSKIKDISLEGLEHLELFNILRRWRHKKTEEMDVPHYMILSQKALLELSVVLPQSERLLKTINGIGPKKMELYGDEVLHIIDLYCKEKNIIINTEEQEKERIKPPKPAKTPTKIISFEMFKQGKSIQEIAEERNFVVTTIETHLAYYVGTGDIDPLSFMTKKKLDVAIAEIRKHNETSLGPIKEILSEDYSWSELKIARSYISFLDSTDTKTPKV